MTDIEEQTRGRDYHAEHVAEIARLRAAVVIAQHRIAKIEGMARGICAMDDAGYGIKTSSVEGVYKEAAGSLAAIDAALQEKAG